MKAIYLVTALLVLINGITSHDCETTCKTKTKKKVLLLLMDPDTHVASFKCTGNLSSKGSKEKMLEACREKSIKNELKTDRVLLYEKYLITPGSMNSEQNHIIKQTFVRSASPRFVVCHTNALVGQAIAGAPADETGRTKALKNVCKVINQARFESFSFHFWDKLVTKLDHPDYRSVLVSRVKNPYDRKFEKKHPDSVCRGPYALCVADFKSYEAKLISEFQAYGCGQHLLNVVSVQKILDDTYHGNLLYEQADKDHNVWYAGDSPSDIVSKLAEVSKLDKYFGEHYARDYAKMESQSGHKTPKVEKYLYDFCRAAQNGILETPSKIEMLKRCFGLTSVTAQQNRLLI